jgi:hypothetical protein
MVIQAEVIHSFMVLNSSKKVINLSNVASSLKYLIKLASIFHIKCQHLNWNNISTILPEVTSYANLEFHPTQYRLHMHYSKKKIVKNHIIKK